MYIGIAELRAFAGKRPISQALRRMAQRENARHAAQPPVPRPRIYPRGEDAFYQQDLARLQALEWARCPLCEACGQGRWAVRLQGNALRCPNGHSWGNPVVAQEELAAS